MRTQRQGGVADHALRGASDRAFAAARPAVLVALIALSVALALAPAAFASHATRRACDATPPPGHAACLAMRLLVEPPAAAQPSAAQGAGRAALANSKPFPGFLTPERLHAAYALPEETAAGSTQTIAVVDAYDDPTAEADLAVYDKAFGLPPCTTENGCFKKVNQKGQASPLPKVEGGWASEISIDVQMARAICQSCKILLVEAKTEEFSDLAAGVNAAVALGATEISNSYGGTEESSLAELESTSYNHPGVVVTVSSGDCGYLNKGCPEEVPGAEFPASSPHVLSVGGTSLTESAGKWTSTVWGEGGSACSTVFTAPFWEAAVANFAATGCGSGRAIADVAAIGDPNTGVNVYDSTPEYPGGPTGWGVWGGTSVAAPIVAAQFGLAGGSQGVSNPATTIYGHAGDASALYDVVSGNNGECAGATICKAAVGFDGPTGLGSPVGLGGYALPGTPQSTAPPTTAGIAEQDQALSAQHGGWTGTPTSYQYQWERCGFSGTGCQPIAGATGPGYTLLAEDIGHQLRVREGAFNATGSGYADSAPVGPVASNVPTISSFSPPSGITGSTMTIAGSGLATTSQVLIGSLSASFTVVSTRQLEVTIPNGAVKGKLAVTTAHGSANSKGKFAPTLAITRFSPQSAAAGATVTIKGVGFNPSSTVRFDGTPAAAVTYLSAKKLKAVVPAGIGTGPITVTNSSAPVGTVSSAGLFTP